MSLRCSPWKATFAATTQSNERRTGSLCDDPDLRFLRFGDVAFLRVRITFIAATLPVSSIRSFSSVALFASRLVTNRLCVRVPKHVACPKKPRLDVAQLTIEYPPGIKKPGFFVDSALDVAIDPTFLDTFISAWNQAELETKISSNSVEDIDELGPSYFRHLQRAEIFLQRGEAEKPSIETVLAPFDSLVAFIMDGALKVLTLNEAAQDWFETLSGGPCPEDRLPPDLEAPLWEELGDIAKLAVAENRVVKFEVEGHTGALLLQVRPLGELDDGSSGPKYLVVCTQRYWRNGQDEALKETFNLTSTECEILRYLVQGDLIKKIAEKRGTSEGTARVQVKTIFSKLNVTSQAEVIRVVLPITDLPLMLSDLDSPVPQPASLSASWLEEEVWRPFQSLTTPDGRKLDYHLMGPADGAPVLYSHMGYCQARWSRSMIKLAHKHRLRVICPIRAGFGYSDNLHPKADVMAATRNDTVHILDHLGISKLPYIAHGNDLVFAVDLIAQRPDLIPELIGICGRPCLPEGVHLLGTGAWQRFFMSTAKFAPQLVHFGSKAAVAMGKRMGMEAMHRKLCKDSPADLALLDDEEIRPVVLNNSSMVASPDTNAAQAFAMEYIAIEQDWSEKMLAIRDTPTRILFAEQDPTVDLQFTEQIRAAYPWIDLQVIEGTGQFLIFQKYQDLIPLMAQAAWNCTEQGTMAKSLPQNV